nr:MAG TPA: hypothetical protein [Caudoviricetes sp.]DAK61170.1 MAG TPA: hypothetical protein [Caudoviricetes sp.]
MCNPALSRVLKVIGPSPSDSSRAGLSRATSSK